MPLPVRRQLLVPAVAPGFRPWGYPICESDSIAEIATALRAGAYVETDTIVVLHDGLHWPRIDSSILIKRACYHPFSTHVLKGLLPCTKADSNKTTGFIISGQQGIGKSLYSWLLLLWLLHADPTRPFIYQSGQETAEHSVFVSLALGCFHVEKNVRITSPCQQYPQRARTRVCSAASSFDRKRGWHRSNDGLA
jgi:hypothetical protein